MQLPFISLRRSGLVLATLAALAALASCGGDEMNGNNSGGSNKARFTFDCDLNGVNGVLTMEVEVVGTSGVVFGSGPNPDVTGVISTGSVSYLTSGNLVSPVATYTFTGRDGFADFVEQGTGQQFLVQWLINGQQLNMLINPFGPGPTQHACIQTSAAFI